MREWHLYFIGVAGIILLLIEFVCPLGAAVAAQQPGLQAAPLSFVVTSDTDLSDRNLGDGVCDISVNPGDQCSLRAALEEVNFAGDSFAPHEITFDIPGSGVHVITPNSTLPVINAPVHILGSSQPGALCPTEEDPAKPLIQLDGSQAGISSIGLFFSDAANGSRINGLAITNFAQAGLWLSGEEYTVVCNVIGLAPDGITPQGNETGIFLAADWSEIGHESIISWRNVISGNDLYGILVLGDNNSIYNNLIGTSADGLEATGNETGMLLSGSANEAVDNVVSGNDLGIAVDEAGNTILSNLIGVGPDGSSPLGNRGHGIFVINGGDRLQIGSANGRNVIANNEGAGIKVEDAAEVSIQFNQIYANGRLGIDLANDGVTANDNGDGDSGANEKQNFPILTARPAGFVVDAQLNSQPDTSYIIHAYRNSDCDSSSYGEGEEIVHVNLVTTNILGDATFEIDLRGNVETGDFITATATDPYGNTSEFSKCVRVGSLEGQLFIVNRAGDQEDAAPGDGVCDVQPNTSGEQCTLRGAIQEANALGAVADGHRIHFDFGGAALVRITPSIPFPAIEVPVVIDGTTQAGTACPTDNSPAELKIILDGSSLSATLSGLVLADGSDGSLVRGLVIGNFSNGITIQSDSNLIACNFVGVGVDGTTNFENAFSGIYVLGLKNVIGGLNAPERGNVVSFNQGDGIFIGSDATGTVVGHNRIGTSADGLLAAGNGGNGIIGYSDRNLIGDGNVIAGNQGDGIHFYFANGNHIFGNSIGLGADQTTALPNAGNGVAIVGESSFNVVGSGIPGRAPAFSAGQGERQTAVAAFEFGNHIAFNGENGVLVKADEGLYGESNVIRENRIHANGLLGIDLGGDGADTNDAEDLDKGENTRLNHPVLSVAQALTPTLRITLNSHPNTLFYIDLYRSAGCDQAGYGEGQEWLRVGELETDENGFAEAEVDLGALAMPGTGFTATATLRETLDTSEFSNCQDLAGEEDAYKAYLPLVLHE